MDTNWDCIVVGGGAAGLSAGLVLGRARRRTLLVDAGQQSNLAADAIGGLLGFDGRPPADLYAAGREEIARYPSVELREEEVVAGAREDDGFVLTLADGSRERTRRVLLATGMRYGPPALDGVEELWGGTVFHCPFCHGWEVRDRRLAVLGNGEVGTHQALLLRGWSDDVVLLTDGRPEGVEAVEAAGIRIDPRPVSGLVARGGELAAVAFADGTQLERDGLMVFAPMRQRSGLAAMLGATSDGNPMVIDPVGIDEMSMSGVPGISAAGDVTGGPPQVATAIAAGSLAAAMIVRELLTG
jgi:thioredoxin reductase